MTQYNRLITLFSMTHRTIQYDSFHESVLFILMTQYYSSE